MPLVFAHRSRSSAVSLEIATGMTVVSASFLRGRPGGLFSRFPIAKPIRLYYIETKGRAREGQNGKDRGPQAPRRSLPGRTGSGSRNRARSISSPRERPASATEHLSPTASRQSTRPDEGRSEARNVLFLLSAVVSLLFAVGAGPGGRGILFTVLAGLLLREVRWANWRGEE
jgi:hypothetical protein